MPLLVRGANWCEGLVPCLRPALLAAAAHILGAALNRAADAQSPKWAQTALSQRPPVFSVVASSAEIKLLAFRFGLCFERCSGTGQRVELQRKANSFFVSVGFFKAITPLTDTV